MGNLMVWIESKGRRKNEEANLLSTPAKARTGQFFEFFLNPQRCISFPLFDALDAPPNYSRPRGDPLSSIPAAA